MIGDPHCGDLRVCVVTGGRADYGLLYWTLRELEADRRANLQLVVTGAHLSEQFGQTESVISADGLRIAARVDMLLAGDSPAAMAKSVGLGIISFTEVFYSLQPDVVLVLGDRFEILAAAQAAYLLGIPLAHIHGGEVTEGAIDEGIRHAITKFATLHFAAAEDYVRRLIQMGEQPENVHNVGAVGLDHLVRTALSDRAELEQRLALDLGAGYVVCTYHPVTQSADQTLSDRELSAILSALDHFPEIAKIFTMANSDPGGRRVNATIAEYVKETGRKAVLVPNLGQKAYLGAIRSALAVIGNSSSGLIEVPALDVPTINVGDRQKGRLRAASVLDCAGDVMAIVGALKTAMNEGFKAWTRTREPPYGRPSDAARKIVAVLLDTPLHRYPRKPFFDLDVR